MYEILGSIIITQQSICLISTNRNAEISLKYKTSEALAVSLGVATLTVAYISGVKGCVLIIFMNIICVLYCQFYLFCHISCLYVYLNHSTSYICSSTVSTVSNEETLWRTGPRNKSSNAAVVHLYLQLTDIRH